MSDSRLDLAQCVTSQNVEVLAGLPSLPLPVVVCPHVGTFRAGRIGGDANERSRQSQGAGSRVDLALAEEPSG